MQIVSAYDLKVISLVLIAAHGISAPLVVLLNYGNAITSACHLTLFLKIFVFVTAIAYGA